MELHQNRQMVVARGNVVVRQGDVRLRADIVSASYKEVDGKRSIHRVDAVGGVVILTAKERLTGDHATYDLERELFLLTGENLRIEGEEQTVTAEESLEYWGRERRAVARGEATAIQNSDNTRLRADVIEAQLAARDRAAAVSGASAGPEDLALDLVRAWGHVVIRTEDEIVEGDRGNYNASKKVATLEGNVRIIRGKNQLRGEKAIVDMEKGVSRLVGAPGERVRSIFYPGSENTDPNPPEPQQPQAASEASQSSPSQPRPRPPEAK